LLIPAWLGALGAGALIAAVINGLAFWWNGRLQREHEIRLRQLQLDHERELDRLNELRSLRDAKRERARAALLPVTTAAARIEMAHLTTGEDGVWRGWRTHDVSEQLERAAAGLEADSDVSAGALLGTVYVVIAQLNALDEHLTGGAVPPGWAVSDDSRDRHWHGTLDRQAAVRDAALRMIAAAGAMLRQFETPVQTEPAKRTAEKG
jgi:hypothetical protein